MFGIRMSKVLSRDVNQGRLWLVAGSSLLLALSGCNSDNDNNAEPPQVNDTTGIWSSLAYGFVADIGESDVTFYQFTSQYCQTYPLEQLIGVDFNRFIDSSVVNEDRNSMITTLGGVKQPGIVLDKQDALPQSCIDNLVASVGEANYEFDPQQEFEILWASFNEQYAFFELEGVDWSAVYEEARPAVTSDTTNEELFGIFAQMLTPLRDFHVNLVSEELGFEFVSPRRKPDINTIALMEFLEMTDSELPISSEAQFLQFMEYSELQKDRARGVILGNVADGEEVQFNDTQTLFWARLNGNVGYLLVNTMDDNEIGGSEMIDNNLASLSTTMDQVLMDLVGVEGLVIDVRNNEGGDDFVSQYIAGRLVSQSYNAYGKQARLGAVRTPLQSIMIEPQGESQFLGPVAVLSSWTTASAAESFTLAMRERMNTAIVGEATAGGFSDQLIKLLPSGTVFTLSNEIYLSNNGEEFEGVGVPVDIEREFFSLEQREAGQDLGFDAAVEWLSNL